MKEAKSIKVLNKVKLFDGKTREGLGDITNIGKVADACVVKREKRLGEALPLFPAWGI